MLAVSVVVAVWTAGCGSLGWSTLSDIDPQQVPFGLLAPPADPGGVVRARPAGPPGLTPSSWSPARPGCSRRRRRRWTRARRPTWRRGAGQARGRTHRGRALPGLGTVLGATVVLSLDELRGGTRGSRSGSRRRIAADQLPLALGQVVLTLTSVPGIERVQLVSGGEPVEMALPGGRLGAEPVTADDYAELVAAAAP